MRNNRTDNDYRENITEAAESYMSRDPFGDDVLEVEVFVSPSGSYRVEWLLACGGPQQVERVGCTVSVIVDSRYSSPEFHHSWGKNPYTDKDQTSIEAWSSHEWVQPWIYAAEELAALTRPIHHRTYTTVKRTLVRPYDRGPRQEPQTGNEET